MTDIEGVNIVPKSNIEYFLQAIIEDSDTPFEAKTRIEQYLTDILEERVSTLEPVFRIEYYLAKISGADVELPEPISKADLYLAALAGEEVTLPDSPNSSLEEYLARWCETGNAVSVITGNIVSFTGRTSTEIQSVSFDLHPAQDSNGYGIFPINSRTGLTVYRVGHELISIPQYSGSENGCALTVLDSHTIRISGTPSAEARFTFPLSTNADFEFDLSTMRFFTDGAPNGFTLSVAKIGPRGGYKNFSIRVKTTFSGEATDIGIHLYAKEDTSNTPEAYMETAYPVTWENKVGHSYDMQVVFNQLAGEGMKKYQVSANQTNEHTVITVTNSAGFKRVYVQFPEGHRIYVRLDNVQLIDITGSASQYVGMYNAYKENAYSFRDWLSNGMDYAKVVTTTPTYNFLCVGFGTSNGPGSTIECDNFQIIDLTLLFGSTIADYIYSLEEANAGAGVAYFRNLFPNSYYDYNAGESMSVSVVSHDVYGGTVDLVSGVLKERPFIASYNGETLVGPWVSSMDAYDPNTTPTIGAQVVDMGGTETIYNLTPHEISALLGRNNIWSDSGDVKVTLKGGFTDQGE